MTIVFATLGFTPKKVLPSVRGRDNVEHVVLFHDAHEESREAARVVAGSLDDLGVDHTGHEVDAFDIATCARTVRAALRDHGDRERILNISGGTRVLAAAALLASIVEGVRVVYVDERTNVEVPLPLVSIRYDSLLNESKRRVLEFVRRYEGDCTQTAIVDGLGLSRGTVSHHISDLKDMGLIEAERVGGGRSEFLRLIPTADLLLDPDDDAGGPAT